MKKIISYCFLNFAVCFIFSIFITIVLITISKLIDGHEYSATRMEIMQIVLLSSITSTVLGFFLYAKNKTKGLFLLWLIISIILSVFVGFLIGTWVIPS